ncbi:metal-sensitive transcriptional regulator [Listeria aquatica]|uniref:Metal-sensitive transcriptional regulator n=1 Tax=Listeria aquatica TaxID=1494960 RepID=A0A841ZMB8_9LIST|nr:metal-sensitive transcriptional regulator [Listeria aquatica]MBC1521446.1 metal-sensitive transcriptional regulator [Listeria aquatica]
MAGQSGELVYDAKMKNRLKRSEGQIRGILKMMEEKKDCREIVTQLTAVRTSIDRVIGLVVAQNLAACVEKAQQDRTEDTESYIEEAIQLLMKSR